MRDFVQRKFGLEEIPVPLAVFGTEILVVLGADTRLAEYLAYTTKLSLESQRERIEKIGDSNGLCFENDVSPIIWMPHRPKTAFDASTLAHEMFHAVYKVMLRAGVPLTEESQEIYAYALGFGVKRVLEHIEMHPRRRG